MGLFISLSIGLGNQMVWPHQFKFFSPFFLDVFADRKEREKCLVSDHVTHKSDSDLSIHYHSEMEALEISVALTKYMIDMMVDLYSTILIMSSISLRL